MPRRRVKPAEGGLPPRRSARIRMRHEAAARASEGASQALRISVPSHVINGPRERVRVANLNRQETNVALQNLLESNGDRPATPPRPNASALAQSLLERYGIPPGTPAQSAGTSILQSLLLRYVNPPASPPRAASSSTLQETNGTPPATQPRAAETVAPAAAPGGPVMPQLVPFSQMIAQSAGNVARVMPSLVPFSEMMNANNDRPQTSRQLAERGAADRIRRELLNFWKDPPEGCTVHVERDVYKWRASITGPEGTPYEGGVFQLMLIFDEQYPYTPPKVNFLTKIYHCNIIATTICLDILTSQWSPALTISKILLSIISLLADPNPDDPLVPPIAKMYKENRQAYDDTARLWTSQYAVPDPEEHLYQ